MSYLRIMRPLNGLMSVVAVYIGLLVAGGPIRAEGDFLTTVIYGFLAVFFVSGGGMVVNDIFDVDIDRVNKPKRPIPSGRISVRAAKIYATVLFIVGNYFSFLIGSAPFLLSLVATVLLIGYAGWLKKVMMAGHVAISFLVALTFVYGAVLLGEFGAVLPLALLAFLANIGREIYKTIDDILGDKEHGVRTLPVEYGVHTARALGAIFIIAAVVLSFLPFVLGILGEVYLFFVLMADIVFVGAVVSPLKHASKLIKLAMILALIAFLAGALPV